MSRAWVWLLATAVVFAAGCGGETKKKPKQKRLPGEASEGMYGVDPSIFKCESIAAVGDISQAIGGEVAPMETMFTPPTGTPPPCDFRQVDVPPPEVQDGAPAPAQRMWSIRFDCRESYLPVTEKEMKRLLADEGATKVQVGQWGVEHLDAKLVFVDDDAPCTVTIVGPGTQERTAIGQLIARKLTLKTAPMTPRPATRIKQN